MKVMCIASVAPLRREANHRAEMVSQMIWGEMAEVLGETGDFVHLVTDNDQYPGWIQRSQLAVFTEIPEQMPLLLARESQEAITVNGKKMRLVPGSRWPTGLGQGKLVLEGNVYEINPKQWQGSDSHTLEGVTKTAQSWLNVPYLWGGRTCWGFDCSGFIQTVFRLHQIELPRDAYQQALVGEAIDFLASSQPGDVAFFENEQGSIIHVGLLLSPHNIIHASGQVRIDLIDSQGIVHAQNGRRTHALRLIRRFF